MTSHLRQLLRRGTAAFAAGREARLHLAITLADTGAAWTRALEIDPDHPPARASLAQATAPQAARG